jgi:hypothetical protein
MESLAAVLTHFRQALLQLGNSQAAGVALLC